MAATAIFTTAPAAAGCSSMSSSTTTAKQLIVPLHAASPKKKLKNTPYAPTINCVRRLNAPGTNSSSSIFHSAIGATRADWLNTCAILSSQVNDSRSSSSDQNHELVPIPNGHEPSGDGATSVDLVPVNGTGNIVQRRPLSISDLSPAPMHGSELRVAYQGVPGAYSEAAAAKAYPGCEAIPCDQFDVAFQSVELWLADRAVLPVENSLGGSIHRNYDLLLRHRLHIVGEVQLPVHHCLLALPGVRKEEITRVMSHPQALAQCEHSLTNRVGLGSVVREAYDDTAAAAEYVAANGLRDTAAIASARAAELYGLQVVADGIQDDKSNVTRFVMLAREPVVPRTDRPFKTSIVFAQDDAARDRGTSVLFKVLSAFAFRDISLTKIESRPHRQQPLRLVDDEASAGTAKHFEYMFYIDFQASLAEPRAQKALAEIQEFTSFLRVLGSYPMDMTPWIHTTQSFNNEVVQSASASNSQAPPSSSTSSSSGQ